MGSVIANMSMSLDGFIEDRNGDAPPHLFRWTQGGGQASSMPGDGREFRTSTPAQSFSRRRWPASAR